VCAVLEWINSMKCELQWDKPYTGRAHAEMEVSPLEGARYFIKNFVDVKPGCFSGETYITQILTAQ
jgi:hypothetical protein